MTHPVSEERKDRGKSRIRIFEGPFIIIRWPSCVTTTVDLVIVLVIVANPEKFWKRTNIVGDTSRLSCESLGVPEKELYIACVVTIYFNDVIGSSLILLQINENELQAYLS